MNDTVTLAHGAGGTLYRELIHEVFLPAYGNALLDPLRDAAVCGAGETIAMTTDSFVISPLFFPGGDIGRLAVCGTVNDLAVSGAEPRYLTVGMIIEAGFPVADLKRIAASLSAAAAEAGVKVVTGDTKVVEKGKCDGIFINTAGVGVFHHAFRPLPQKAEAGDVILCSSCLADHGTAVMASRAGMCFDPAPQSDVRPLASLIGALMQSGVELHAMRDPTRGGAACTLCEFAEDSGTDIILNPGAVPVKPGTAQICELLGIDPLTVANEGAVLIALPANQAPRALEVLHSHPFGADAAPIAEVEAGSGRVLARTQTGTLRRVLMPAGEILPRIC